MPTSWLLDSTVDTLEDAVAVDESPIVTDDLVMLNQMHRIEPECDMTDVIAGMPPTEVRSPRPRRRIQRPRRYDD